MEDPQYAIDELRNAVELVAREDLPPQSRLQQAWDQHVQMLWEKRYLTGELHDRFSDMWYLYTAKTDDPRNTQLRDLSRDELSSAISDLVGLAIDAARLRG